MNGKLMETLNVNVKGCTGYNAIEINFVGHALDTGRNIPEHQEI